MELFGIFDLVLREYITVGPGLTGGTTGEWDSVLFRFGWTVRYRSPSLPLLKWVWMDAVLALSFLCTSLIVSYPG